MVTSGLVIDGWCGAEEGFDLAELDAVAADLDLVVEAAEEFDVAGGEAAGEVAGAVEALAGLVRGRGRIVPW